MHSFRFLFNGHNITLTDAEGENMLKSDVNSINETFFTLVSANRPNNNYRRIFSTDEFKCLPYIYNNYIKYLQRVSYASGTRLYFHRQKGAQVLYLDELEAMDMVPDFNTKQDYYFGGFTGASYIESEGKRMLFTDNLLYKITSGIYNPGIPTTQDLAYVYNYYNNVNTPIFKYFGTYNEAEDKWTFIFTANISYAASNVANKMIPDPGANKNDYNIDLGEFSFTVTNYITSGNSVILNKENDGDRKLYEILTVGTFTE